MTLEIPVYQPNRGLTRGRITKPIERVDRVAPEQAKLNKQLQEIRQRIKVEHDVSRARHAVNDFRGEARDKLREMRNLKGSDAHGVQDLYQKWYTERLSKINESLNNVEQQEMFGIKATAIGQQDLDVLAVHEAAEHHKYRESVLQGVVSTWKEEILLKPTQSNVDAAVKEIKEGYEDVYSGMDRTADINRVSASLHVSALQTIMENDPGAAKEYVEKWKGKLGGAYGPMKEAIRVKGVKKRSQVSADIIMGTEIDPERQLQMARDIDDPDVRDATVSRIKARQNENRVIKKQREEAFRDSLTEKILDAGNLEHALDVAEEASGGLRHDLTRVAKSLYQVGKGKGKTETDYAAMYEAMSRIDTGAVNSVPQLALEYRKNLKASDFEEVVKYLQNGGNIGGLKDSTVRQIFQHYSDKDIKSAKGSELYNRVWRYVVNNIEPGKKPTNDMIRKLVATALVEGEEVVGGWWDTDMSYVEAVEKGVGHLWLPDVPKDLEGSIEQALGAAGKALTEKNKRLYYKHVILEIPES